MQILFSTTKRRVLKGGYKSHFPAQILSNSHFPAWFFGQIPVPAVKFQGNPSAGEIKAKTLYLCAVNVLNFRLGYLWSVLSPSVTNAMTIKLWKCIGRLNMFPLRSASWIDDVMWRGNYVIAPSGCHHESWISWYFHDVKKKEQKLTQNLSKSIKDKDVKMI